MMREFQVPMERFAGFDLNTRLGYIAALSVLWENRKEQAERAARTKIKGR